ncbi:hypothetical protein AGABI2DRAFT_192964 [Agaricus bisporus var. bisporus H97]|uniref:hypothetical protein n=1 Tax=Agaricus bisporus var. bisporus (strain H97 / ATCC MYA-4626 / FGSC 10389) TaxID=936046 RepID=UPI00029F7C37|nr:hypothetical protein AGABI2DRAFT_192964 [Agaricus bisporus var. bisporus H97]EKV47818.1 hypothetical protein AGABI2DRAFT_192964 [Agaricus bisporus var. bisporus H97]
MATDAPPTAYKENPCLIEWESLPEEDQIKQQEEMTKFLQEPSSIEQFIEECKAIGRKAAAIESDFTIVLNSFVSLAEKYGAQFPDLLTKYVPRWVALMARWTGSSGLLWSSRKLATETADALAEYEKVLLLIADIHDQSELEGAQSALRDYVAKHPIDIAIEVADGFKTFRLDILQFSDDFSKFVGNHSSSTDATSFEASIKSMKQCQEIIVGLNEKVYKSAMALGCSSVFGILSDIPVASIGQYIVQRNEAQANLVKAKSGFVNNTADSISDIIKRFSIQAQKYFALLSMQAEFERFKPNIINICQELVSFAYVWTFATSQSIAINVALEEGMVAITRLKFKAILRLAIAQIEPLREGLKIYAAQM